MTLSLIRKFLRGALSIDVIPYSPGTHPLARRMRLLKTHGIDLVLDIGANVGRYGATLRDLGYRGRIISFEPLAAEFAQLAARSANDGNWEAVHAGVGPKDGNAVINVAGNSQSSSLLPMLETHLRSEPRSAYVGTQAIRLESLASISRDRIRPGERVFIKLDTQGYERTIIESAGPVLARAVGMQVEMSLVPLYRGECLMTEMTGLLRNNGFMMMSVEPGFCDPNTGQLLQIDGVFFRE